MLAKAIILVALLFAFGISNQLRLHKHPIQTGARCLDGTPSALYIGLGSAVNRTKFLLYFRGGGLCRGLTLADTLQSCYERSFTETGSSGEYPQIFDVPEGCALVDDPEINPSFYDWTRVYVPYCDGSEHQGSRLAPVSYKGRDLYFRGMNNTIQHFEYLNATFGMYAADTVVLTGASAGGVSSYHWANYLYERSLNKRVFSIPDSGLFVIEHPNPVTGRPTVIDEVVNLVKLVNTQVKFPIPECSDDFGSDHVMCFSAGHLAKYQKAPFFIVQSQYDAWSIHNILGFTCAGGNDLGTMTNCTDFQKAAIEEYRTVTLQALRNLTTMKTVGIWSPTCIQHSFTCDTSFNNRSYTIPTGTGITCSDAIAAFLKDPTGNHIYMDDFGWPTNEGCNGLDKSRAT